MVPLRTRFLQVTRQRLGRLSSTGLLYSRKGSSGISATVRLSGFGTILGFRDPHHTGLSPVGELAVSTGSRNSWMIMGGGTANFFAGTSTRWMWRPSCRSGRLRGSWRMSSHGHLTLEACSVSGARISWPWRKKIAHPCAPRAGH